MTLCDKAQTLRRLHQGPDVLLLPNAWDVASARLLEDAGFPAIATTSAGIAFSLGYPDGQRIPAIEMLAAIARITNAVDVPVTADFEGGYHLEGAAIAVELITVGAVGLNMEDVADDGASLIGLAAQAAKITQLRDAASAAGVPLVINARTDALFLKPALPGAFAEAVKRARAYRAAGADCIFVPGLSDPEGIRSLLAASPGALNILGTPSAPSVATLQALGVRRISLGSGPYRAALGALRNVAQELRGTGSYTGLAAAPSYDSVNASLSERTP
ncbi:MAG TPA: isocitrate lyase/phosphoenolpyruvate mutase family protein [Terriglobales bacterium]|nr:isocitrate lyase/phosphoenolpyruvate mutase family protein [Terriglobales bacterium]